MTTGSNTKKILLSQKQAGSDKQASQQNEKTRDRADIRRLVCFMLAGHRFGLDINQVEEIIRLPEVDISDPAQSNVLGTITVRGQSIPLVDLRARMGLPGTDDDTEARVILCEYPDAPFGLLVDAVTEVLRSPASRIRRLKKDSCYGAPELYAGTYTDNEKEITILDCTRLWT